MAHLLHHLLNIIYQTLNILGQSQNIIQFLLILDIEFLQQPEHLHIILELIFLRQSGTNIYSVSNGKIVYLGFNGANGYTIMIENNNKIFSYSHISPKFIINLGDTIYQNQLIANVGPKYIEHIPNNPYSDSTR